MFAFLGNQSAAPNRALFCQCFDGLKNQSKITAGYWFKVSRARVASIGATTGTHFPSIMVKFLQNAIPDGIENRFLYDVIANAVLPYDQRRKMGADGITLKHIFIVSHLIGQIIYKYDDVGDSSQRFLSDLMASFLHKGQQLMISGVSISKASFYAKGAERVTVSLTRFKQSLFVLFKLKEGGHKVTIDKEFIDDILKCVADNLSIFRDGGEERFSYVNIRNCEEGYCLFSKYLLEIALRLFDTTTQQFSSGPFAAGEQPARIGLLQIGERKSLEHRLLAMPYRFFLKSDLSGKITGPNGTEVNGPFHNDNPTNVSLALDVLVSKQLLSAGEYIQKGKLLVVSPMASVPSKTSFSHQNYFIFEIDWYRCRWLSSFP
ncbi:unnamed protein product [Didymodactylos carnosus]|uniref:Uncharacterized protein n=1 Tax=Didymodactylos carnosus TaxID=1234261 RepID=A0A8S2Y484_9BILA|nr:unnamed protein product [Didymodactylos carnosus]